MKTTVNALVVGELKDLLTTEADKLRSARSHAPEPEYLTHLYRNINEVRRVLDIHEEDHPVTDVWPPEGITYVNNMIMAIDLFSENEDMCVHEFKLRIADEQDPVILAPFLKAYLDLEQE